MTRGLRAPTLAAVLAGLSFRAAGAAAPPPGAEPRPGGDGPRASPGAGRLSGLVVRSKEYVVRRSTSGTAEEFSGEVSYRQGGRRLEADWALLERDAGRFEAVGRVSASMRLHSGDRLSGRGHRLFYDDRAGDGGLQAPESGRLVVERAPPASPGAADAPGPPTDFASARSLEWNARASRGRLRGDVHAWGPDGESRADALFYDHAAGRAEWTGRRPVLLRTEERWTGAVQADRITAHYDSSPCPPQPPPVLPQGAGGPCRGRIEAEGSTRGWIVLRKDLLQRP